MKNFQIDGLVELSRSEAQRLEGGGFLDAVARAGHAIGYACGVAVGVIADTAKIVAQNLPWPSPR